MRLNIAVAIFNTPFLDSLDKFSANSLALMILAHTHLSQLHCVSRQKLEHSARDNLILKHGYKNNLTFFLRKIFIVQIHT